MELEKVKEEMRARQKIVVPATIEPIFAVQCEKRPLGPGQKTI